MSYTSRFCSVSIFAFLLLSLALSSTKAHAVDVRSVTEGIGGEVTSRPVLALGSTPMDIHSRFARVQESNFSGGNANELVARLSDKELVDLAAFYRASSLGQSSTLLSILASRVDPEGLIRVSQAFGIDDMRLAISASAPRDVAEAFELRLAQIPMRPSSTMAVVPLAMPTLDMSISEIYLEFRTAPIGSVGARAALAETSAYAGGWLTASAYAGWKVGGGISYLIENYAPDLGDAIGGTVAGMIDQMQAAGSDVERGQYMQGVDDLFGGYIQASGNFGGDFGVTGDMGDYFSIDTPCGPTDHSGELCAPGIH